MGRLNRLDAEKWRKAIEGLNGCPRLTEGFKCPNLKEIRDFEWSAILLQPSLWGVKPEHASSTRAFNANELDLHSKGLGEEMATVVLAGLLPRVSAHLEVLNIRYDDLACALRLPHHSLEHRFMGAKYGR